jgi:hypothetical protein
VEERKSVGGEVSTKSTHTLLKRILKVVLMATVFISAAGAQ